MWVGTGAAQNNLADLSLGSITELSCFYCCVDIIYDIY
jgi:hypothetical protein